MFTRLLVLRRRLAVGLFLAAGSWCPSVSAAEGFHAAVALERSFADVDYEKSVGLDSPFSAMTARDDTREPADALKAAIGYRWPVSGRLYLAGEIEGAFYLNDETGGFLEGHRRGRHRRLARDVDSREAPCFRSERASGVYPRFAGVPGHGAVALPVRGAPRWIDADIEAEHLNRRLGIAGSRRADPTLNPWLVGLGIEFGGGEKPFRLAAWPRGL